MIQEEQVASDAFAPPPGGDGVAADAAQPQQPERSPLGLFAAAVAALMPVLYVPVTSSRYWSGRYAVMLMVAAVGLILLFLPSDRRGSPAVWGARGFALVALLAAVVSQNPLLSLAGRWNQGTGALFLASLAGAWAIGVRLNSSDRALLKWALAAGVAASAAAAILSVAFDLSRFGLETLFGRAMGYLGNPVHLGPLCAAGVTLVVSRGIRPWVPLLAGLPIGATLVLAGSPAGLALVAIPLAWAVVRRRWLIALLAAGGLLMGGVAAPLLSRQGGTPPPPETAGAPDLDSPEAPASGAFRGRDLTPRLGTWKAGAIALTERPLLGHGPGLYGEATLRHRSLDVVQGDPGRLYNDAHNWVVEISVGTGLLGVLLLAVWLASAALSARGPLALYALILGIGYLYQPLFIATLIPAMFALGAAGFRTPAAPALAHPTPVSRWLPLGALAAATVVGGFFLYGMFALNQARLDLDLKRAHQATDLLLPWAEPWNRVALIHQFAFVTGDRTAGPLALLALEHSVEREPRNPRVWVLTGDVALSHSKVEVARVAYLEALELDPFSVPALRGLTRLEAGTGDLAAARRWAERAIEVDPSLRIDRV